MNKLLILGAGGHSKVVAETALATRHFDNVIFLDDKYSEETIFKSTYGDKIIGPLSESLNKRVLDTFRHAAVAIGDCTLRIEWLKKLIDFGYKLPSIIHPSAIIANSSHIDFGTVVFANAVVQSEARIGKGVILNTSCNIDLPPLATDPKDFSKIVVRPPFIFPGVGLLFMELLLIEV